MKLADWVRQEEAEGRQPVVLIQPVTANSWVYWRVNAKKEGRHL